MLKCSVVADEDGSDGNCVGGNLGVEWAKRLADGFLLCPKCSVGNGFLSAPGQHLQSPKKIAKGVQPPSAGAYETIPKLGLGNTGDTGCLVWAKAR